MSWERAADERIEQYRTTAVDVVVETEDGEPVRNASVEVEMRQHAFGFGTAVNAAYLVRETEDADKYRTVLVDLFNKAALENRHKWGFWELTDHRELAETATKWLLERDFEVRGHTCIWQRRGQGAIPDDIVAAMDAGDRATIERRSREQISDIVGHYADVPSFTEWDVLNEQIAFHELTDVLDPDVSQTRAPTIPIWFRVANRADPDARLYINEYNVLVGDDAEHRNRVEDLIRYLLDHAAPLEGIGMQAHHSSVGQRRTPEQLLEILDRFAALVSSIQVQEYDTWGADWTEKREAKYLYQFLKTVYSHPGVDGFLMWGFWDEIHWQGNAPLFRDDWSEKPAYDVYTALVFGEWWTDESGETGCNGVFSTNAFLGAHEIAVTVDGRTTTVTETFDDPDTRRTVTLRLPI